MDSPLVLFALSSRLVFHFTQKHALDAISRRAGESVRPPEEAATPFELPCRLADRTGHKLRWPVPQERYGWPEVVFVAIHDRPPIQPTPSKITLQARWWTGHKLRWPVPQERYGWPEVVFIAIHDRPAIQSNTIEKTGVHCRLGVDRRQKTIVCRTSGTRAGFCGVTGLFCASSLG